MIRLINSDCIAGMREYISSRSVDAVMTSPPYNIGTIYRSYNDKLPRETYLQFMGCVRDELARVLATDGSLFLNMGSKPSDPTIPFQVLGVFLESFCLQNVIHWIKSIAIDDEHTYGHYKPINSDRYINDCHEYIFHLTLQANVKLDRLAIGIPYKDKSNISRWGQIKDRPDKRCRGNTWFIPYKTICKRTNDRPHPASFPVAVPRRCFELHGVSKINLALDPFCGIGNSAIAAKELGLNFIGFEIDDTYFQEAVNRTT